MNNFFEQIVAICIILVFYLSGTFENNKNNFSVISVIKTSSIQSGTVKNKIVIFPIQINIATHFDLVSIPGIGRKLAMRIINHRKKIGSFKKIEELKEIEGIKEKKFKAIKRYLTVERKF